MATKSGKDGKVLIDSTALASITHWSLRTVSHNPAHASSATGGVKTRNAGVKDSSGTIRFKLDFTDPITSQFIEGSLVLHGAGHHRCARVRRYRHRRRSYDRRRRNVFRHRASCVAYVFVGHASVRDEFQP
jgi:hypothetical protein